VCSRPLLRQGVYLRFLRKACSFSEESRKGSCAWRVRPHTFLLCGNKLHFE